jgi:hypothetical protein
LPPSLKPLQQILSKGVQATAPLWPPLQSASAWVHQAAHLLTNQQQQTGAQVRERSLAQVGQMRERSTELEPLGRALQPFCHIPENFAEGLFPWYDVEGLPRPNKDWEHGCGRARVQERRATGRRGAIAGVVVRGSVRVMTPSVTRQQVFQAEDLPPHEYQRWRDLRAQWHQREETRRRQLRLRKDPAASWAHLEAQLLM